MTTANEGKGNLTDKQFLDQIEQELQEKRKALEEKTEIIRQFGSSENEERKAQLECSKAEKELAAVKRRKNMIAPLYESTKSNPHLAEDVEHMKQQIQALSVKLEQFNKSIAVLDSRLTKESKKYKVEENDCARMMELVNTQLSNLATLITEKVEKSATDIDAEATLEQYIADFGRREQLVQTFAKMMQERSETNEICEVMTKELKNATLDEDAKIRRLKDKRVLEAVWEFQDERAKLQSDIEAMQKIFTEQSTVLLNGAVQKEKPKHVLGPKSKPSLKNKEEEMLRARADAVEAENLELKAEKMYLENEIANAVKTKSGNVRDNTVLANLMKKDKRICETALEKIKEDLSNTKIATIRVVKENDKLASRVKELTDSLNDMRKYAKNDHSTKALPTS